MDRNHSRKFSTSDDELTCRVDVYPVRRLRRRQEVDRSRDFQRIDDAHAVIYFLPVLPGYRVEVVVVVLAGHHFASTIGHSFLNPAPVDGCDKVLITLRRLDFEHRVGFFTVVRGEEHPVARSSHTGTAKVEVVRRNANLEGQAHHSGFWINLDEAERAVEVLLVG